MDAKQALLPPKDLQFVLETGAATESVLFTGLNDEYE
jgi:hypothetical protein